MILTLLGCMPLDGFFFNATPVDSYLLDSTIVPDECSVEDSFPGGAGDVYGVWTWQGGGEDCVPDMDAPILIYFHGNEGNLDTYWDRQEIYWQYGFTVYQFDYRGYGKSAGEPDFAGVIEDGRLAVDHVQSETGHRFSEFSYLGLSLGGFVAVHNLADRPPARLITEDMFASVEKMLEDGTDLGIPPGWVVEDDWDNLEPLSRMDPAIPHLVMHGDSDTFIEPEHAQLVFDASASATKDLWLVKGADHAEDQATDPEGYAENVNCWLLENPSDCLDL